MPSTWLDRLPEAVLLVVSLGSVLASILGAMRAGVLRKVRLGSIEFEASKPRRAGTELSDARAVDLVEPEVPFESQQLAKYYSQVLGQSRVSFWFSLIFASLGFAVIIAAALMYSDKSMGSSVASFVAGVIVDAVAALFFVQSRESQKAMAEFFDKLRADRERLESRRMTEIISNPFVKDALRVQLVLHLAGVPEGKVIADSIIGAVQKVRAPEDAG
jgi:hypothetical protein